MKNLTCSGEVAGTARLSTMAPRTATGPRAIDSEASEWRRTRASLIRRYARCRAATEALAAPLSCEDQQLQSMPSCSPTKWHRAHTTWFFEAFVLQPAGVPAHDDRFKRLYNSYYESVGARVARDKRGLLSRPSSLEVADYRRNVDVRMLALLESLGQAELARCVPLLELGLAHEEQHQELLLTDILHAFSENPCAPVYREATPLLGSSESRLAVLPASAAAPLTWHARAGGVVELGAGDVGFAFDNERPRHRVYVHDHELASRPVSVAEVKAFIEAGGYETPSLWLSEGYEKVQALGWKAPLHARWDCDGYRVFGLHGGHSPRDVDPASHVSFWEAEAIARFLGARLPTEAEWECAARAAEPSAGNFADGWLVPRAAISSGLQALFGDVWEWTRSSYDPYPGYRAPAGAIGEYNGKFMAQQIVLRGGSCLTPRGHVRASYRNFWHPDTRFQMTGLRLARDL